MKTYKIYKITNQLNGKSYIGLTYRSLQIRLNEHITESKKDKNKHFHFHMAIQKYGINNFTYDILIDDIDTLSEANQLEIFYIKQFNTYKDGYNMTEGGGGRDNYYFSDEAKKKMSKSKLGGVLSYEHKDNISKSLKGKPKSDEHRLKVIEAITGLKRSDEVRRVMSERMMGKNTGNKNPSAITVHIFNEKNELVFICEGDFNKVCDMNGLPSKALRKSYYNNGKPIYTGKTIKKSVLLENGAFIGWYALKIT